MTPTPTTAPVEGARPTSPASVPIRRRDQVLRAALELFAVHGYPSTTMSDIGQRAGIRGPSIYRHYESKQHLLTEIVLTTMDELIRAHDHAISGSTGPADQLRRATEAHVRYHARHRFEAAVGNREIRSVEEPAQTRLLELRAEYEHRFRSIITTGASDGTFTVESPRLASYAILDMGMGVSLWYRDDGPHTEDQVVHQYGQIALLICLSATHANEDPLRAFDPSAREQ